MRAQSLRARAAALVSAARQAESLACEVQRKQRDRAAYCLGCWILAHDREHALAMLPSLAVRDRVTVTAVLTSLKRATP
jgi:hypothetical protein